jgi:hypothetical protein
MSSVYLDWYLLPLFICQLIVFYVFFRFVILLSVKKMEFFIFLDQYNGGKKPNKNLPDLLINISLKLAF